MLPSAVTTVAGDTPTGLLVDSIRSPGRVRGLDGAALGALAGIAVVSLWLAHRRLARTWPAVVGKTGGTGVPAVMQSAQPTPGG